MADKNELQVIIKAKELASNDCCYWLKEKPCDDWAKEHESFPFLGMMASEGGQSLNDPLHTIVTKDRFALVTVLGNEYAIMDIFLRMLNPEELKRGQGFPEDYIIDHDYNGNKYPVSKQVARIGNSVVPIMAQKLVEANCPYLKVGERMPNMRIDDSQPQLRFA